MKILVTGGAGFIGSHIVESYLDLGYEVTVVDDLSTGKLENLDIERCAFIKADISKRDHVNGILERYGPFDVINHQAAQMSVSDSVKDPYNDIRVNIIGTLNLLEVFGPSCKKFIFASSGGTVYGEHHTPRAEGDPLEPVSPYGISKLTSEKYIKMYSARFGFEYTILRYSNVYGPRQNPHGEAGVVAIFLNKILNQEISTINGDGVYLRDYIEVSDVVSANLASITTGVTGIHNVSTGVTLDVNQIWDAIVSSDQISGYAPEVKNGPHREGDIRYSCCIPGEIPGWGPKISFEEGIKGTVSWFINNK